MGHLSGRRGKINGSEARAGNVVIKALVPFSEMLSYANELISLTQGRGSYSMESSHYDYVPQEIAEKVIAAHKPHHAADEAAEEKENGRAASA
jgi:elongation factor G